LIICVYSSKDIKLSNPQYHATESVTAALFLSFQLFAFHSPFNTSAMKLTTIICFFVAAAVAAPAADAMTEAEDAKLEVYPLAVKLRGTLADEN